MDGSFSSVICVGESGPSMVQDFTMTPGAADGHCLRGGKRSKAALSTNGKCQGIAVTA
jgi:hypothetical protein